MAHFVFKKNFRSEISDAHLESSQAIPFFKAHSGYQTANPFSNFHLPIFLSFP